MMLNATLNQHWKTPFCLIKSNEPSIPYCNDTDDNDDYDGDNNYINNDNDNENNNMMKTILIQPTF